jgi:hypothetical protein
MARTRKTLNEMEAKNAHSVTQVNRSAVAGEPMQKLKTGIPDGQTGGWEDLGGPTPENSKPDDDSNKISDPAARLKRVSDAVTRHAKPAETMQKMREDYDDEDSEDLEDLEEEEYLEDDEELQEGKHSKKSDKEDDEDDEEDEDEEDEEEDDDEDDTMKESAEEEYDLDEDVEAIVAGEGLSEEFKEKTRVIYEAAVRSKVSEISARLEEQYEAALVEEVQAIATELQERVDAYLEYVADEWLKENQLAVQYGIKEQIAESFLSKLFGLFEEHHVNLPEEKYDIVENMVDKLDEMENKLNEQIEKNMQLTQALYETKADKIFDEVADGLAITQQEKLASLAESVEFESEESYRDKLVTLRESYFPQKTRVQTAQLETLSEGVEFQEPVNYTGSMSEYLRAAAVVANI